MNNEITPKKLLDHEIIPDVSNVVGALNNGSCKLDLYFKLEAELHRFFERPKIYGVTDYRLKDHIDNKYEYTQLLKKGRIMQVFPDKAADHVILGFFAQMYNVRPGEVWVVSNDKYREHQLADELRQFIINFRVIDMEIQLISQKLFEMISIK